MPCCKTSGSSNTGKGKQVLFGTARRYYLQHRVAADGTLNFIDGATFTGSQSDWDALTQNADYTKRLFPIGDLEEFTNVRAESIKKSFASGTSLITEKGQRTVTTFIPEVDNQYAGVVDEFFCDDMQIYASDTCGNFQGYQPDKTTQLLFGARIQKGTFESNAVVTTDGEVQGAAISFEFHKLVLDKFMRQFNSDELVVNPNEIIGLIDVDMTISGASTTGFIGATGYIYGTVNVLQPMIGIADTKFTLFNETTQLAVAIIAAPETIADGTYTFSFVAQTSADILTLTLDLDTGFDLSTTTITIP